MASPDEDLLMKAKKLESEGLAEIKLTPEIVSDLDGLLSNAYVVRRPKPMDYLNRRDLIRIFNVIAKEIYGNSNSSPVVEGYGSFVMDIFNGSSDLDLSINFINNSIEFPREKKIEILRKFAKKLHSIQRKGHVTGLQSIMTARVPIVKVTDRGTGIECDLSVENKDGIAKSHIIHAVSGIDERFPKLSFLMKCWAKAHNINSSKDHTLNSLSIVSLVAFHLQTCNPPILPPFSAFLKDGADPASVARVSKSYSNYGRKNVGSLAELFITLFVKLASIEKLWQQGLCASLYEGAWISKSWGSYSYSISIEDFTDRSQNFARAVRIEELKMIYRCIHDSLHKLMVFLNGQMQGSKLVDLLFGIHTGSNLGFQGIGDINNIMNDYPASENPNPTKKMRSMEVLEDSPVQKLSNGSYLNRSWQGSQPWKGRIEAQRSDLFWSHMHPAFGEALRKVTASITPSVSYQPPLAIISSDGKVHYGPSPGPGTVLFPSAQNPIGSAGSSNPSTLPRHISPHSSIGFVGPHSQEIVTPKPYPGSVPPHLTQASHNLVHKRP